MLEISSHKKSAENAYNTRTPTRVNDTGELEPNEKSCWIEITKINGYIFFFYLVLYLWCGSVSVLLLFASKASVKWWIQMEFPRTIRGSSSAAQSRINRIIMWMKLKCVWPCQTSTSSLCSSPEQVCGSHKRTEIFESTLRRARSVCPMLPQWISWASEVNVYLQCMHTHTCVLHGRKSHDLVIRVSKNF